MYRLESCTGAPPLVIELAGSPGTLQLPARIRKELATSSSFSSHLLPRLDSRVRRKLATFELVSVSFLLSSSSSPVGCAMETALALAAAVLLLSSTLVASEFCVCRSEQPVTALQKVIDFSCGDGADCSSILQGGGCYNPNTVAAHCSWAANSYYQNNKAKGATCDFGGAATISTTDPSFSGCTFPSTASVSGATGTTTVGGATTGTLSPGVGTGLNGTGMGSSGLGPAGNMDGAAAGLLPGAAFLAAAILSLLALH